ncbi:hypothetical protein DUI87_28298 [Hirundo rustica rustica]|uniref:DUF5745 domain-containing protein n=1 Tax=Hirundo rustica rustica TaxID=333673 RepID=A0A3M0J1J7_HIRRU|nr:hypothetical protein DUI87_28298 [Hirundo rustica rustica]
MGSAEGTDWVDVANDLLRTCQINQHIKHLSECNADVFVHLYESILGEVVPDFIATPRSQEDDAHNVQAIIDSLALDYLQVSLSHITGENIVKGDRESIRNLLEIFDGLLEYLREVSEASSQTGAEINALSSDEIQIASQEQLESAADQLTQHTLLSSAERSQSEYFILTCDTDGSESTSELIKLGDTAYSFSKRGEEFQMPVLCVAEKDREVEESESPDTLAALPRQFSESEREIVKEREDGGMESVHAAEPPKGSLSASATKLGEPIQQAIPLLPPFQPSDPGWRDYHSSDRQAEALACSQALNIPTVEKSLTQKFDDVSDGLPLSRTIPDSAEDSLSHRTTEEKVPEQEFHEKSENLSRRLNELDLLVTKAYENELRNFEAREKHRLSQLREAAKEVEQEYKENVFQEPPKVSQPVKVYSRKTTPQYPKYSQWIPKRGIVKPKQAAPMTIRDNDLLLQLLEEFPHLHISPHTLNKMWQRQLAQTAHLKAPSGRPRPKLLNEVEQALKKQELLAAIIKKDQDHSKRLEIKLRAYRQKWAQNKVTEKRQQVARARKYYEDYRAQLRAKLLRARTREEKILKNLFEEGLEIQKQRLRDLRVYAQEKRDEQRREHQIELESLENYYKDQFSMLAEAISQEFQEIQTREKAQAQMLQKTRRELRSKMEKEIQQLQAAILHNDDDTFFQELEADRLRSRLQIASFQYSQSHFF